MVEDTIFSTNEENIVNKHTLMSDIMKLLQCICAFFFKRKAPNFKNSKSENLSVDSEML